ncbi:MAG: EamA family transporter [Firmicutes bacterium]|jgi:drug/metabolite transporter (DMT)-like permease|nr:EamA family transporter [Bacillota bacterium]
MAVPSRDQERGKPAGLFGLPRAGLFHLLVVYLVWGSTYLGIRLAVEGPHGFPPFYLGAVRMLLGGGGLLAYAVIRGRPVRFSTRSLAVAALSGVFLWVGGNGLVMVAERHLPSGYSALVMGGLPIWVTIIGLFSGQRLRPILVAGMLIGLGGLYFLTRTSLQLATGHQILILLLVAASWCWALGMSFQRWWLTTTDAQVSSAWQQLFAGGVFVFLALVTHEPLPHPGSTALIGAAYLVVLGSWLAFTSFILATRLLPMTVVTTYSYVNPLVAVVLGALVLGERVTSMMAVGGFLLLLGVGAVIQSQRTPAPVRMSEATQG